MLLDRQLCRSLPVGEYSQEACIEWEEEITVEGNREEKGMEGQPWAKLVEAQAIAFYRRKHANTRNDLVMAMTSQFTYCKKR